MGVLACNLGCLGECHLGYSVWLPSMGIVDLASQEAFLVRAICGNGKVLQEKQKQHNQKWK